MYSYNNLFLLFVFLFNIREYLGEDRTQILIQPLTPYGIRVGIPDRKEIELFTFSGRINNRRNAAIQGTAIMASDEKWQFQMDNVDLSVGDTIYYTAQIENSNTPAEKIKGTYRVERLFPRNSKWPEATTKAPYVPEPATNERWIPDITSTKPTHIEPRPTPPEKPKKIECNPSPTKYNGGMSACSGRVIFEENFFKLNKSIWTTENRLPRDDQENPFVLYSNDKTVVYVENKKLYVKPKLLQSTAPYSEDSVLTGSISLYPSCTAVGDPCHFEASGFNILPPIISGRVTTAKSFNFKYGTIEIRAKVPAGDWLYPELYLIPQNEHYGSVSYASGIMRVGFVRSNTEMRFADTTNTEQIDHNVVYGGLVLDQFSCHSKWFKSYVNHEPLTNDFHTYSLTWKPDGISLGIDGVSYGTISSPSNGFGNDCPSMSKTHIASWGRGTAFAPFDQEFHIALGVGAGGVTDFPDNILTTLGKRKPWQNLNSKAKLNFWRSLSDWNKTWGDMSSLVVDSVKVRAL